MTYSLNEIEVMAMRATRGIGFAWGLAQEAGKAARWLTQHDLPGAESLAELLRYIDGKSYGELAPVTTHGRWHANDDWLCPLIAGALLSDSAFELRANRVFELGPTAQPLLLAYAAANAARLADTNVELSWHGASLFLTTDGACIEGSRSALAADTANSVQCHAATRTAICTAAANRGRAVPSSAWRRLSAYAQRTYAPATDESRISGAGATLEDDQSS